MEKKKDYYTDNERSFGELLREIREEKERKQKSENPIESEYGRGTEETTESMESPM